MTNFAPLPLLMESTDIKSAPFIPKPSLIEKIYLTAVAVGVIAQWFVTLSAVGSLTLGDAFILLGISTAITAVAFFGSWWAVRRGLVIQATKVGRANVARLGESAKNAGYWMLDEDDLIALYHDRSYLIVAEQEGKSEELTLVANESGTYDLYSTEITDSNILTSKIAVLLQD